MQPSLPMRGTAVPSTAGQGRLDRGQRCAAGTLYARSMGGHGTLYPQQGRGPGTSTAASNYAKLAPARGAWSCLPPPLLLAASSAALSCEPASLLLFSPVHTPSTPAVHPPCFPLVVSPSVDRVCIVRLTETRSNTATRSTSELSPCQPFRLLSPCYRPGHPPLPRPATAPVNFQCGGSSSHPRPTGCLLTHPDPETVARRGPRHRLRSSLRGDDFVLGIAVIAIYSAYPI